MNLNDAVAAYEAAQSAAALAYAADLARPCCGSSSAHGGHAPHCPQDLALTDALRPLTGCPARSLALCTGSSAVRHTALDGTVHDYHRPSDTCTVCSGPTDQEAATAAMQALDFLAAAGPSPEARERAEQDEARGVLDEALADLDADEEQDRSLAGAYLLAALRDAGFTVVRKPF